MIRSLFHKVVVAVNGSASSMNAAMYGIVMAKAFHSNLRVIYVVDTVTIRQLTRSHFFLQEESQNTEAGLVSDGERNLEYIKKLARKKGVVVQTEIRKGAVWSEVVNAADEYKADLILLGGQMVKDTSSVVMNDISLTNRNIIGSAHCSVLVVNESDLEQLYSFL